MGERERERAREREREREIERERERILVVLFGLYFLAIVVFLTSKSVGSVFAKYNLEC